MKKKCAFPGCNTILSSYNKFSHFCWRHQELLEQSDIKYKKGKFYFEDVNIPLEKVKNFQLIKGRKTNV